MTPSTLDDPAVVTPAVAEFAARVRTALADLEPDTVDDLTDGLEADLLERAAESGDAAFGDPEEYAAELRAAAGLPPRSSRRGSFRGRIATGWRGMRAGTAAWLQRHPRAAAAAAFLVALRPAWWVLRALLAAQLILLVVTGSGLLPGAPAKALLAVALIVLSVQFGRGRWLPVAGLRVAAGVVHVILIVAALPLLVTAAVGLNNQYWAAQPSDPGSPPFAVTTDGRAITNVFVYDAHGEPVPDAQLFLPDGTPLDVLGGAAEPWLWSPDGTGYVVPSDATPGRAGWNVYPLSTVEESGFDEGRLRPDAVRHAPEFPFDEVPALAGAGAGAGQEAPGGASTPAPTLTE